MKDIIEKESQEVKKYTTFQYSHSPLCSAFWGYFLTLAMEKLREDISRLIKIRADLQFNMGLT